MVEHLAASRRITGVVVDRPKNVEPSGKDAFRRRLLALSASPDFPTYSLVLILADNDDDPDGRFAGIQAQVRATGLLQAPVAPRQRQTQKGFPALEIAMMPATGQAGCSESLCYHAAAGKRPGMARCVEKFVACVEAAGWPTAKLAKLKLRCLIAAACPADPNRSLQYCWSTERQPTDLIPLDDPIFDPVADYLRGLVG